MSPYLSQNHNTHEISGRVFSKQGERLAQWHWLTNVEEVDAATVALWYDWRWRIESFFKRLQSAGHQSEYWQPESALAIAKRLLVASMACVTVWEIAADQSEEAAALKGFLIQLSGRQMRRGHAFTPPALLAGWWVFLSRLEVMDAYSPEELSQFKATTRLFMTTETNVG